MTAPQIAAERVIAQVLEDLHAGPHLGVVVDSPPGAGKSTLVIRAALQLAETEQVMAVAQTNEQVDDLVHRLAVASALPIGRLSAQDYVPSERLAHHPTIIVESSVA